MVLLQEPTVLEILVIGTVSGAQPVVADSEKSESGLGATQSGLMVVSLPQGLPTIS